jgi:predicted nucleic acid binding AN1-type Zn finger protein
VPSLNLKPNPCGGTAKKITSSLYNKSVEATQKKKTKQAAKSIISRLALNVLLGPSKRRKRRVCWDPTPSDTPSDSDTDLAVPFANDSTGGGEEQDADCVFCTGRFSEDHNGEN